MSRDTGASSAGAVSVRREGAVLHLLIDRPATRNSLSPRMIDTLVATLTDAAGDPELRAVHLGGSGADFCSGVDWVASNNADRPRPRTGDLVRRIPHTAHRVIELLHTIQLPVVCGVRGWAAGLGCNLALAADFTVAADDAVFWEPFVTRGFSPDSGSTWLLPRLIGLTRAKRMLLLGEKVSAADAAEWGLIDRCVPAGDLHETVAALLAQLAAGPTVALGLAKQALAYGQHATLGQSLHQELYDLELSCRTTDFKEGLTAFQERRTPDFQGR
ncbi:enoyl-CoA hydratase/isomerase family protein [Nocardia vaccinii]|uniref:enoyl-CoA hydratase/isomerase family protein n=1 Tax=Nocardia vaccinii TaxID=1822 RepID=UPI0009FF04D8|nr:enoyl-CoA hydratase-related protein [Nocardia vaccinii]